MTSTKHTQQFTDLVQLYTANRTTYGRLARHVLGSYNRGQHEDIVQESMRKLMAASLRYPDASRVATDGYIRRTIRNTALDEVRRVRLRSHASLDAQLSDGGTLRDVLGDPRAADPGAIVQDRGALQLIREHVEHLSPTGALREAWEIRSTTGFDDSAAKRLVADRHGHGGAAWSRHTTAWCKLIGQLKTLLEQHGYEDVLP